MDGDSLFALFHEEARTIEERRQSTKEKLDELEEKIRSSKNN